MSINSPEVNQVVLHSCTTEPFIERCDTTHLFEVELPWPDRILSPNSRVHWSKLAKAKRKLRQDAYYLALNAGAKKVALPTDQNERLYIWIDFYPPDRRRRDDDNLLASTKAARDGIADALAIDDKRFVSRPFLFDRICVGGKVLFTVTRISKIPNNQLE